VERYRLEDSSIRLLSSHHLGPDRDSIINQESSTEEKYSLEDSSIRLLSSHHLGPDRFSIILKKAA
jgi:hypothetical protein